MFDNNLTDQEETRRDKHLVRLTNIRNMDTWCEGQQNWKSRRNSKETGINNKKRNN